MSHPYRTLFVGTLVQESFLSVGGTDDPFTTVDSPFCRDGRDRPTLRGTGLAGALVATLRRTNGAVPQEISGSSDGAIPSVWRTFSSHPAGLPKEAFRQHVAIDKQTDAAATGALFNVETLPPGTRWPFLLEIDTSRCPDAADLAREALAQWAAGRCLIGREVARGLGWMRLDDLHEYPLTTEHIDQWPNASFTADYPAHIAKTFAHLGATVAPATNQAPNTLEISGRLIAGARPDGYGIDSLSIGGHASEELAAEWDKRFLAPEGMDADKARLGFDPDFAVVTYVRNGKRLPYIPGSSLRGPLRHALARLLRARGQDTMLVDTLFGTTDKGSARLLIRDALPVEGEPIQFAWLQHHAEDEFTAGAYGSSKFDRITVMEGTFAWKMVLEAAGTEELKLHHDTGLQPLLELAQTGQIGLGGGQWRGHGWLRWEIDEIVKTKEMTT